MARQLDDAVNGRLPCKICNNVERSSRVYNQTRKAQNVSLTMIPCGICASRYVCDGSCLHWHFFWLFRLSFPRPRSLFSSPPRRGLLAFWGGFVLDPVSNSKENPK